MPTRARILMCPPTHYTVDYVINPWMHDNVGAADRDRAQAQWEALRDIISSRAEVVTVSAGAGLPDMPFTANAGLTHGDRFVPSRFRHPQRQGEEPLFAAWAEDAGFRLCPLPRELDFEGAGDALFERGARRLWLGHGHRSDPDAARWLADLLGVETIALRLEDPRFYHLDTCFCPLAGGWLLYYPPAFDARAREAIAERIPEDRRIAVSEQDALAFACNAVNLGDTVIVHRASEALRRRLAEAGFATVETPLDEFLKAGGSAKCLTLRLDEPVA